SPPCRWVRPRRARWKACEWPLASPGTVIPSSRSAPGGGAAPSVTEAIRSPSTSIRTRSATPRPGPPPATPACQALTAVLSAARQLLDDRGQGLDPGQAVVDLGRLGRAVAGAGRVADEQHGRGRGGGQGAGVVAGGRRQPCRLQARGPQAGV